MLESGVSGYRALGVQKLMCCPLVGGAWPRRAWGWCWPTGEWELGSRVSGEEGLVLGQLWVQHPNSSQPASGGALFPLGLVTWPEVSHHWC